MIFFSFPLSFLFLPSCRAGLSLFFSLFFHVPIAHAVLCVIKKSLALWNMFSCPLDFIREPCFSFLIGQPVWTAAQEVEGEWPLETQSFIWPDECVHRKTAGFLHCVIAYSIVPSGSACVSVLACAWSAFYRWLFSIFISTHMMPRFAL